VLVTLAGDDGQTKPDDGVGGRRGERRRRAKVERGGRVVERALRQTVHRTPSSLTEDVVTQALHGVGRQLLMTDDNVQQYGSPQSRYDIYTHFGLYLLVFRRHRSLST